MKHENLHVRTKTFALKVVGLWESLSKDDTSKILGRQLLRAGTSVGANYRTACRAKSKPDFISKLGTALEEADESAFWIELLLEAGKATPSKASGYFRVVDQYRQEQLESAPLTLHSQLSTPH